ncbi:hypothetical protein F4778DRAFT_799913 [Xylariomycetidae sp. FL2044]|nr:hypothetical protein F4778DRAFT_799909 [Xylariomycetidae sp. FL2044]KAH9907626.1 hypothetical protein F4778DRAFT_799913 [Xylariomycetidae sp. FL2044]
MAKSLSGPGLLYVNSKIVRPDILDEATFTEEWYDKEHIPDVVATSGIPSAVRAVDTDPMADRPYLALYQVDDLAFLQSPEFLSLPVDSEMLPASGHCFDLADFDVRYYNLVDALADERQVGLTRNAKILMTCHLAADESISNGAIQEWFRNEHRRWMGLFTGHSRSLLFSLATGWHSGKGETAGNNAGAVSHLPRCLVMDEFELRTEDVAVLIKLGNAYWHRSEILDLGPHISMYGVARSFGGGFFEEDTPQSTRPREQRLARL